MGPENGGGYNPEEENKKPESQRINSSWIGKFVESAKNFYKGEQEKEPVSPQETLAALTKEDRKTVMSMSDEEKLYYIEDYSKKEGQDIYQDCLDQSKDENEALMKLFWYAMALPEIRDGILNRYRKINQQEQDLDKIGRE